jgi:hypothetical protein
MRLRLLASVALSSGLIPLLAAHAATRSATKGIPPQITVIAQLPPKSAAEATLEAKDRAERFAADRNAASTNHWLIGIGIVQSVVFSLQLIAFVFQARRLNQTVRLAREQSNDMRRSIKHAARGARAMEAVADAMVANTKSTTDLLALQRSVFTKQLRAYLIPLLGAHIAEDATKNYKHEIQVVIKNGGATPAHAIRAIFRIRVLPIPLPADADLDIPEILDDGADSYGFLTSQDTFYVRAWLDDYLSDEDNTAIKTQQGKALYAFGVIRYKDIFDEERQTKFCKMIGWLSSGAANWISVPGRSTAT